MCTVGGGAITAVDSGQILDDIRPINANFNPNTGVGDSPDPRNPNFDPWTGERLFWQDLWSGNYTDAEKALKIEEQYGSITEEEKKLLEAKMKEIYVWNGNWYNYPALATSTKDEKLSEGKPLWVSRDFNFSSGSIKGHLGIDYACNIKEYQKMGIYPVYAGTIHGIEDKGSTGNGYVVSIKHVLNANAKEYVFFSHYSHLIKNSCSLNVNDSVTIDVQIGELGTTGYSDGYHLHLGIYVEKSAHYPTTNPYGYWSDTGTGEYNQIGNNYIDTIKANGRIHRHYNYNNVISSNGQFIVNNFLE